MPTTVRLDAHTLALMRRLARRTGRTNSDIIRQAIRQFGDTAAATSSATAYEAMAHALGCWDSGGARLSERTGPAFAALLRTKREQASSPRAAGTTRRRAEGRRRAAAR